MTYAPASLRYNNPGAMYPGPSAQRFGSIGTQTIGGGHKIAVFDDPVKGAAAQFDLLRRRYTGLPLSQAIARWSGGNSVGPYLAGVSRDTGLSPNTVLTPDLLASPQGVALARRMAQHEAGRPFPLSDEQWTKAQRMGLGGPPIASGDDTMKRPVLAGLSNIAANLPGAVPAPPPMATGSISAGPRTAPQGGGGWNLFDAMTNPLTLAGLSILGDPERNVGRGMAIGVQAGGDMMERRRQATAQNAFQEMLAGVDGEARQFAPMIAQMGPERGVPVLLDIMDQERKRKAESADFGKAGTVVRGADGQYYAVRFKADGTEVINPLRVNGQTVTPDRGVDIVGDTAIDKTTGTEVRNVGDAIARGETAKKVGDAIGEGRMQLPKTKSALDGYEATDQSVMRAIADARKIATDSPSATGAAGGLTKNIWGTPGFNLQERLKPIRANLGFDKLQSIRDNSPTGGALGQVAVQELDMLQSTYASLAQAQSKEQFLAALDEIEDIRKTFKRLKREAYQRDVERFGAGSVPNPETGGTGTAPPPAGRATHRWNPATGKSEPIGGQ